MIFTIRELIIVFFFSFPAIQLKYLIKISEERSSRLELLFCYIVILTVILFGRSFIITVVRYYFQCPLQLESAPSVLDAETTGPQHSHAHIHLNKCPLYHDSQSTARRPGLWNNDLRIFYTKWPSSSLLRNIRLIVSFISLKKCFFHLRQSHPFLWIAITQE